MMFYMRAAALVVLVTLGACGGAVENVLGEPPPEDAAVQSGGLDGGSKVESGLGPTSCTTTKATQAACWGAFDLRYRQTASVDFTTCSDDGRAFVDQHAAEGFDCFRPSRLHPEATVWCCDKP